MKKLLAYTKKYRLPMIAAALSSTGASVAEVMVIEFLRRMIDAAVLRNTNLRMETFFECARKYGGFITGMIQNVDKMLGIPAARTMLKNSENIIMMGQDRDDARILAEMYDLSSEDVAFLIDAEPGFGINKIGKNIFQFDGTIPKTNIIYGYINSDGHSLTG